jgi:hypothetical protein
MYGQAHPFGLLLRTARRALKEAPTNLDQTAVRRTSGRFDCHCRERELVQPTVSETRLRALVAVAEPRTLHRPLHQGQDARKPTQQAPQLRAHDRR